ncbi:MAG: PLD nuclease N-terminal domain-containing protein [Candidatus Kariarchaeaceae archaeon]|jgi:hypothetical protein
MELTSELLIIIIIVAILQIALLLFAARDWMRQPEDMPNRLAWLLIIAFVGTIGPVLYFLVSPRISAEESWLDPVEVA